ncbi:TPA: antitermination protein [Klebsiella pneumoniae]|uniref:antiterminator Q family protein n=1 Tax=Klebsiella pneumoniae TaxID=573 RepID=UPI000B40F70B|nr:antiterminator Q family protein [Klebsiella pneumoniae]HDS5721029.1 antitermination protein [Klebsiella pneumoniae subsp. pneumoniae]ELO7449840.1 antitermination protein [Klebsiella pneumoniae]MCE0165559.1 antitermination protein [Klebsiella pneumoniae]OVW92843.1 antitermination protein [Klebsiella pneumoniae]SYF96676.1 antitermination protein from phage origin [Klebsiella pneumoniae]
MRDIQLVLERWGAWASNEGSRVDWSPVGAGFKGLIPQTGKSRPSCGDNDGIIVDTAVGMLGKTGRHDELKLIMLHYMYDVSKSTISRWEKCSEGKIRQKLMIAETFIDACIIMSGATLEMDDWMQRNRVVKVA